MMAYKTTGAFGNKERKVFADLLRNLADELDSGLHVEKSSLSNQDEFEDIFIGNQDTPFLQSRTGFQTLTFQIKFFDPDARNVGPSPLMTRLVTPRGNSNV